MAKLLPWTATIQGLFWAPSQKSNSCSMPSVNRDGAVQLGRSVRSSKPAVLDSTFGAALLVIEKYRKYNLSIIVQMVWARATKRFRVDADNCQCSMLRDWIILSSKAWVWSSIGEKNKLEFLRYQVNISWDLFYLLLSSQSVVLSAKFLAF